MFKRTSSEGKADFLFRSPSAYSGIILMLLVVPFCIVIGVSLTLFLGVNNHVAGGVDLGVAGFVMLLYFLILPRRLEIYNDRIAIIVG